VDVKREREDVRRRRKSPVETADNWNRTVRVGDLVEYRGYPEAKPQRFQTRTVAQVLMGHTAVVWLDGKAGCVTVEACKPVPQEHEEQTA
jgi:hypothetical protein